MVTESRRRASIYRMKPIGYTTRLITTPHGVNEQNNLYLEILARGVSENVRSRE